jgi:hypothetical protein
MHIPSEIVQLEMLFEPAFLWFVPTEGADTHAVLIKADINVLKSIVNGVKIQLFCGIQTYKGDKYLCLQLKIFDDINKPLSILKVQRNEEEHSAFWEILNRESTPLFLFDNLSHCVAYTLCKFDKTTVLKVKREIQNPDQLYSGVANEDTLFSMDYLESTIELDFIDSHDTTLRKFDLKITLEKFETLDIYNYSVSESHQFRLDANDEGGAFEQRVWAALESIFPFDIYKSPQVWDGSKKRELTDILCLVGDNLLLFESKAASVFASKAESSMERKVIKIQNHINKALDQLEGAIKQIRKKNKIIDFADQRIEITSTMLQAPHAIIIVSEILPFGNWDNIVQKTLALARRNQALFQIIDIRELMNIIVASSKTNYDMEMRADAFDYYLFERFDAFVKNKNIFMRIKFVD